MTDRQRESMNSYTEGVSPTGFVVNGRTQSIVVAVATVVTVVCFIIAIPRSGGPDEPSHMVASAALVRGEVDGQVVPGEPAVRSFDLPIMVGFPDPGCWARQPQIAAACAPEPPANNVDAALRTTSYNYPPWAYVLPGLASFVAPPDWYAYLARMFMAAVPLALVCASLARARRLGRGAAVASLIGLTPIAWFSMSIVNPSAVAIGGGLALWTALLIPRARSIDFLLIAGWLAVLLPRRDGPIWVLLIVLGACVLLQRAPLQILRDAPLATRAVLVASVMLPPATALFNEQRGLNLLLSLAPLGLVPAAGLCLMWRRFPGWRARGAIALGSATLVTAGLAVALSARPGGYDATVTRLIVGKTGEHLRQLVGVLGWLDAPAPLIALFAFWVLIGVLIAGALTEQPSVALFGAAALATVVVAAWVLELGQGDPGGTYWQGRYSMPFVVGLPLALALRSGSEDDDRPLIESPFVADRHVGTTIAAIVWIIWNMTFVAALHRWGAGLDGPWPPSSWESWNAPAGPTLLIVVHAVSTGALLVAQIARSGETDATEQSEGASA